MACLVRSNVEVIRSNISVNDVATVNIPYFGYHLVEKHENCFKRESFNFFPLFSAEEKTFERRTHEIHDKNIAITFVVKILPSVAA